MGRQVQTEWQVRRSAFNHQWLKNQLLLSLDMGHNIIRGRVQGAERLQEIMDIEAPVWLERRQELQSLLDDFETEMSPRHLLDNAPLSRWDGEAKDLMTDLVTALWSARYPAKAWLDNVRDAAKEVDQCYEGLRSKSPLQSNGTLCAEFSLSFEQFRDACRTLSQALEKLPSKIQIT